MYELEKVFVLLRIFICYRKAHKRIISLVHMHKYV